MASSKLRPAVADRDTSDRPLPPTNLSTCTRARGSRPTFDSGVEAESRWIEGHDVSRRRRPLPPDRTIRPRLFTAVASFGRASGIPVARPLVRAALAGDCEPVRPSQDRRLSGLREETERVSDPGMPSFDRTLGLPSARSIPTRALRRGCDPVNVTRRSDRQSLRRRERRGKHLSMRVLECHPRPSPRRPVCCATRMDRGRAGPLRADFAARRGFKRASLGLRLPTDFCNACSTRGHAREP